MLQRLHSTLAQSINNARRRFSSTWTWKAMEQLVLLETLQDGCPHVPTERPDPGKAAICWTDMKTFPNSHGGSAQYNRSAQSVNNLQSRVARLNDIAHTDPRHRFDQHQATRSRSYDRELGQDQVDPSR